MWSRNEAANWGRNAGEGGGSRFCAKNTLLFKSNGLGKVELKEVEWWGMYWHYIGCVFINIAALSRGAALVYRCREGLSQHGGTI